MLKEHGRIVIATVLLGLPPGACHGETFKRITVETNLKQGGVKQADKLSLHFVKGNIDCSLNFYSEDSEKYIESLDSKSIPVVFDVSYAADGKPSGALLVKVGDRDASKFQPNERLLAVTQKLRPGEPAQAKVFKTDSPAGCFDSGSTQN